jgi:plasmid stabilization system protein ParE
MAEKMSVLITPSAENQITAIHDYIFEAGNPLNAERYTDRLISFIYSLALFPRLHSLCRVKA